MVKNVFATYQHLVPENRIWVTFKEDKNTSSIEHITNCFLVFPSFAAGHELPFTKATKLTEDDLADSSWSFARVIASICSMTLLLPFTLVGFTLRYFSEGHLEDYNALLAANQPSPPKEESPSISSVTTPPLSPKPETEKKPDPKTPEPRTPTDQEVKETPVHLLSSITKNAPSNIFSPTITEIVARRLVLDTPEILMATIKKELFDPEIGYKKLQNTIVTLFKEHPLEEANYPKWAILLKDAPYHSYLEINQKKREGNDELANKFKWENDQTEQATSFLLLGGKLGFLQHLLIIDSVPVAPCLLTTAPEEFPQIPLNVKWLQELALSTAEPKQILTKLTQYFSAHEVTFDKAKQLVAEIDTNGLRRRFVGICITIGSENIKFSSYIELLKHPQNKLQDQDITHTAKIVVHLCTKERLTQLFKEAAEKKVFKNDPNLPAFGRALFIYAWESGREDLQETSLHCAWTHWDDLYKKDAPLPDRILPTIHRPDTLKKIFNSLVPFVNNTTKLNKILSFLFGRFEIPSSSHRSSLAPAKVNQIALSEEQIADTVNALPDGDLKAAIKNKIEL